MGWIPDSLKWSICDIPPKGIKLGGCMVSNYTGVQHTMGRVERLVKKGGEMKLIEAHDNLSDLISQYQLLDPTIGSLS